MLVGPTAPSQHCPFEHTGWFAPAVPQLLPQTPQLVGSKEVLVHVRPQQLPEQQSLLPLQVSPLAVQQVPFWQLALLPQQVALL